MHMIGQRMNLDRKPKRNEVDQKRGCPSVRRWKLIPGTPRLLQKLASLSTPE